MNHSKNILKELPIEILHRGKYQPRREFDEAALCELAESIKSQGIIQPIVVRPDINGSYEIIAGERRWRASQKAQLATVTCLVRDFTDEQAAAVTTIENIQREDLNPIEEAQSYLRLANEFYYSHEEIAAIIGVSRVTITNMLRLLSLDHSIQKLLIEKQLSPGHGKVIAGLSIEHQRLLASMAIKNGWSVRQIESEAKKLQLAETTLIKKEDPDVARLAQHISEQVGAPVQLEQDFAGGWLKIRYFNADILSGILEKMGINNSEH